MPQPKLLATLVHISDLHIGRIDPASGDAAISTPVQVGLDNFPLFDGLLGHHAIALQDLEQFVEDLRAADEKFHLIATGDLSRDGDVQDLALARNYLEQEIDLNPPAGNFSGLHAGSRLLAIPGNHDHWAGHPTPVGNGASNFYAALSRALPATHSFPLGRHGHMLLLVEVDSDADVAANSSQRTFARGSFTSQLHKLDALLAPRPAQELRVLAIHHARTWLGFTLGMSDSAKRELDRFLEQHQIAVILCGHTHLASARRHYPGSRVCWECGAGTTTQFETVPFKWRLRLRRPRLPKPQTNTLMLHRIYDIAGRLEWEATTYVRSATGFNALSPPRQFAVL
ncbi:metallophosphoesterase [Pseudoduganella sp.]|uniref:metallophosphoesterase family protein n=1 Tax=Pseudoduganella sp. TaxID=1880898 RepID=UPI0035B2C603